MDRGAIFVATCLAAAIGCFIMGLVANYPIAQAPGMGLNAFFTYSVVLGMGYTWQVALAAVFVSGVFVYSAEHFLRFVSGSLTRSRIRFAPAFLQVLAFSWRLSP